MRLAVIVLGCACGLGAQERPGDPGYFTAKLYPVLQSANCRACHNPDGVASATRLHFPEPGATAATLEAFGRSLVALVDQKAPEKSLLLNKPTLRIPHTGGKRIPPGTPGEAVLRAWVGYLAGLSPAETAAALRGNREIQPAAVRTAVLRRLTHSQYNHTVLDLLGDDSRPADQFPPEDFVNGYKGQFEAQSIGPLLADAYSAAAEKLARNAFRGGDSRTLIPCRAASPGDPDCGAKFVRAFGQKAFRRPLAREEERRYTALLVRQGTDAGSFLAGAQAVVEAMLQSPEFLCRVENGADPARRPYEAASRLSYFLWDSMPDDVLLRAAAAGDLNSPAGYERQARRLLADPKAHRSVDEFVSEWLRFDRVWNTVKDRRSFPQFTPELTVSMTEETRRLAADLVWNDRNFLDLFTARYGFLNADLAAVYGLPAPEGEYERVSFPQASDRAGVVGEATFLALTSKPAETSPTARGLFVREQFLCQHVPDPPPGVNTNLPPVSDARPMTTRERLTQLHLSGEVCAGCHNLIDPIGFGLENYDALGQWREKFKLTFRPGHGDSKEKKAKTIELPIDSSGKIAGIADSEFSSARELGRVLASTPQCRECVVKQLFRYASGRLETPADRGIIVRSLDDFRRSQFRFKELMISLARWIEFPPGRGDGNPQPQSE